MFGKKVKKKYRIYQDIPYFTSFEYTYAKVRNKSELLKSLSIAIGKIKNWDKNGQNGSEEKSYYIKFRPTFWYSHRDACVSMNTKSQFD